MSTIHWILRDDGWNEGSLLALAAHCELGRMGTSVRVYPLFAAPSTPMTWPRNFSSAPPLLQGKARWTWGRRVGGLLRSLDGPVVVDEDDVAAPLVLSLARGLPIVGWARRLEPLASIPYGQFERVVAGSRTALNGVLQRSAVLPTRIFEVDAPTLEPRIRLVEAEQLVVAVMGAMGAIKGVDLVINALAELARQKRPWELWLFGDGPERVRWEVYGRAMDVPVTWIPLESWEDRLGAVDLLIAPQFDDGLAWDVEIAKRAGIPVVAGDLPVMRERLQGWAGAHILKAVTVMEVIDALDGPAPRRVPAPAHSSGGWNEAFSF